MRFLHLADVHLDTPFASRSPRLRRRLRDASREAFTRAVDLALAERVHAVLIAGDLFDGSRLSFETESLLIEQLRRLSVAGVSVVYATGNHDPGREGRMASLPWPDGVTVVRDATPRRIAVRGAQGTVVGHVTAAGHRRTGETSDLSRAFPRPDGHRPEVALLHAQVVGARDEGAHDVYAPAELGWLERAGYHYWALGHVHTRQELSHRPAIHYPGNLQGRTPAETGPRGGLLVEMTSPDEVSVEFRELAPVRWETVVVDQLERAATLDALVAAVARRWAGAREADPAPSSEWMVRAVLSGGSPLAASLSEPTELEVLARELTDTLGVLDVDVWADGVHAVVDPAEHRRREDVLGVALRRIVALRDGDGAPPAEWRGELSGGGDDAEDLAAYVADLLDDAEGEVLARMLEPEGGT